MDYTGMTDDELVELIKATSDEWARRQRLASREQQMHDLLSQGLVDEGLADGAPWRQPTGAHDAYPLGWVVTHVEKTWESLVDANVGEPGVSGWREKAEWPDWVQPTGAHDAYALGAKVTHNATRWTSDLDANVWEPGVSGWTEVSP